MQKTQPLTVEGMYRFAEKRKIIPRKELELMTQTGLRVSCLKLFKYRTYFTYVNMKPPLR